jgi:6-phosphogluconolactonase (cycloisomerase 2 family)
LYASNRGPVGNTGVPAVSNVVAFSIAPSSGVLSLVGWYGEGAISYPRAIGMDPDGRYVFACSERGANISTFQINAGDGSLTYMATTQTATAPSFIGLITVYHSGAERRRWYGSCAWASIIIIGLFMEYGRR